MSIFLRKINRAKWLRDDSPDWLAADEFPADSIQDLKTDNNSLSLYEVAGGQSRISTVIAALAATRDSIAHFDYVLLAGDQIVANGFLMDQIEGETPNPEVNQWHFDLVKLTGSSLVRFGTMILSQSELFRRRKTEVVQDLITAAKAGALITEQINPTLWQQLKPLTAT